MTNVYPCRSKDSCPDCPYGGPKVGGKGDDSSSIVVVAESPGRNEVKHGYPLAGSTGTVVHNEIGENEAYFINAMECSPPPKNKDPKRNARAAMCCRDRMIEDITAHPRKVIIAMGAAALWALTGDVNRKITRDRGQLIPSPMAEIGIIPMLHPAALMRGTGSYRQWKGDVQYALNLAYGKPVPRFYAPDYVDVDLLGVKEQQEILERLKGFEAYGADIETGSLGIMDEDRELLDIGVEGIHPDMSPDGMVYRFGPSFMHEGGTLRYLIENQGSWVWHNGKFDINHLWAMYGVDTRVDEDTMLLSYALDEQGGVHDLDTVGADTLNAPNHKSMVEQYLPKKGASYRNIPQEVRTEYLGYDVGKTSQIYQALKPRVLEDPDLSKLYSQVLLPASAMLARVERRGMYVDMNVVSENDEHYKEELAKSREKINELAGKEINPNSPQQVKKLLYEDFKLPNKAKGGTGKDVLEKLPQIPIVKAILHHRRLAKIHGTYIKSIYKNIKFDGRVHPTYLIHGTATGRLSSREPNMQNIPRESVIRGQFGAPPGMKLLDIDLAQAELRVLAALSGDPDMIEIFNRDDIDLHTDVARYIFGIDETVEPTKEQRVVAKTINFGIIYGRTGYTIAEEFGMSVEQGNAYVQGWFDRFPVAAKFIEKCRRAPGNAATITTCFGRKKRHGLVTNENIRDLKNEAANFPEQSIASDITLMAAVRCIDFIEECGAGIVNLVHDSIVVEVPNEDEIIHKVVDKVRHELAQVPKDWGITSVPFESDAEIGTRWGQLEKMDLEAA